MKIKIRRQSVYSRFHCLAGSCPDSCCQEWEVQVDEASAERYRSLSGDLGQQLRQVLREEDGDTYMTVQDGRCPMWRQDGLCRIQAELGEAALCKTCREFPRLCHDYGDFQEWGLELSCPEAAGLLLREDWQAETDEIPGAGAADYDEAAMAVLRRTRETALAILRCYPAREAMALLLLYGQQAQAELDGEEETAFESAAALETAAAFGKPVDGAAVLAFFKNLEILTPRWRQRLDGETTAAIPETVKRLAQYFVERYWLQAVSDYDLLARVKWTVLSCMTVCLLGGDFVETAQLFSKEIENDADNVDALLDAAFTEPAFTDDRLLGWTLQL